MTLPFRRFVSAALALLGATLLLASAGAAAAPVPAVAEETPIEVPPPSVTGFTVAWRPTLLSVRVDSGSGAKFGSDKIQPLRGLVRYTGRLVDDRPFLWRLELEGGQFITDADVQPDIGFKGADVTARALLGAATHLGGGVTLVASAGLLSRYQRGSASQGAPNLGLLGLVSNMEVQARLFPAITLIGHLEGALTPFPFGWQPNLGELSDATEFRAALQLAFDINPQTALDVGLDFTRWHASFTKSSLLGMADQALLIESRAQALTIGLRFK